ncbi:MAG: DegV family protein [Clostridia bacterium]|nr:DegV family protein [Clostridia bacterium]
MFKIVADSSCDLTSLAHLSSDLQFGRAPLRILVGDTEYVDEAGLDTRAMMDAVYAFKGKTGSACPSPEEYADHCRSADETYIVTISSNLSGSYNSAVLARDLVLAESPEKKIHVFNTFTAGPELSLIVEEIARLASSGLPFEMVCAEVERYMQRTTLLFQLNSLENLTKNGRVSKMAGMTAKLLGIHMIGIASDVGTVQPLHKCRGTEKTYRLVLQEMRERGFTGGRVILGHAFQEKGAEMMKNMILEEFPSARITVMPLSGLCCYYAEEGGLLVGFERG